METTGGRWKTTALPPSALYANHGRGRQEPEKIVERPLHVAASLRFQLDLAPVLGIGKLRVGAQQEVGVALEQAVQMLRQRALTDVDEDAGQVKGHVAEKLLQPLELLPEELGYSGQHVHVVHHDGGKHEAVSRHGLSPQGNL